MSDRRIAVIGAGSWGTALANLLASKGFDMPICHETYRILYENLALRDAVYRLMTRDLKAELDKT